MDSQKIIFSLKKKYPEKAIICYPDNNPQEILCEIDPATKHPKSSTALAIVGKARTHYHKVSTEIYEVIKGELSVYLDGKKHILKKGEKITINPGVVHYAEGKEVWFFAYSKPGWTFEDHILV